MNCNFGRGKGRGLITCRSLGDCIDSIDNPREIPTDGEKQADPELHLQQLYHVKT